MQVSKEIKKLRDFEAKLLKYYQVSLKSLYYLRGGWGDGRREMHVILQDLV
jgi:hypothetical protein